MANNKMFPFITKTWNPIAGGPCTFGCRYCWATDLKNKKGGSWKALREKYTGDFRVHTRALNKKFKDDDFVFVQDMGDIGDPRIPPLVVSHVFWEIAKQPSTKFLLLTKNPRFFYEQLKYVPENCVLGTTIESDIAHEGVSKAPLPHVRANFMYQVNELEPERELFVSIEPIMRFTIANKRFFKMIADINPRFVAVGYDNYKNNLPEPTLKHTNQLIRQLELAGIKVYRKTMREANNEQE